MDESSISENELNQSNSSSKKCHQNSLTSKFTLTTIDVNISKYKEDDITKLKNKYESNIKSKIKEIDYNKIDIKKKKSKKHRHKISDPEVNIVSELFSKTNFKLKSPLKISQNEENVAKIKKNYLTTTTTLREFDLNSENKMLESSATSNEFSVKTNDTSDKMVKSSENLDAKNLSSESKTANDNSKNSVLKTKNSECSNKKTKSKKRSLSLTKNSTQSPQNVSKHSESVQKSLYSQKNEMSTNSEHSNTSNDKNSTPSTKKNAFQFMMESRNHSIGQNSPGKEKEKEIVDPDRSAKKEKLMERRSLLSDWAEKKGGAKRKIEEEARENYIESTLQKRAKRMKKMLEGNFEDGEKEIKKKSRKKMKVISESEDSNDSLPNTQSISDEIKSETKNGMPIISEEHIFTPKEKISEIPTTPKESTTKIEPSPKTETTPKENTALKFPKTKNDDILLSPSLKKTSLLHYFDVKTVKSSPSQKYTESPKSEPKRSKNNSKVSKSEGNSSIKVKLNFTPKNKSSEVIQEKKLLSQPKESEISSETKIDGKNSEKLEPKENGNNEKESEDEPIKIKMNFTPKSHSKLKKSAKKNKSKISLSLKKDKENVDDESKEKVDENLENQLIPEVQFEDSENKIGKIEDNENKKGIKKYEKVERPLRSKKKLRLSLKKGEKNGAEEELKNDAELQPKTPVTKTEQKKSKTPKHWKMKLRFTEDNTDATENDKNEKSNIDHLQELVQNKDQEEEFIDIEEIISDDEIFPLEKSKKVTSSSNSDTSSNGSIGNAIVKNNQENRKPVKIAPLFLMSNRSEILAANEAKRKFLQSGVPQKMKKLMQRTNSNQNIDDFEIKYFPEISHIQQREDSNLEFWDLPNTSLILPEHDLPFTDLKLTFTNLGTFTNCKKISNDPYIKSILHEPPKILPNLKTLIQELKKSDDICKNFPVYKIFRNLRQKCGERFKQNKNQKPIESLEGEKIEGEKGVVQSTKKKIRGRPKKKKIEEEPIAIEPIQIINLDDSFIENLENLPTNMNLWTEKYKPMSSEDILSNVSVVTELKSWLKSWVDYSIEQKSSNQKRKRQNSNSSFDDFCCSDSDTRDTDVVPQNTMILVGPHGSGKTCTVYALCNELNINVIEINASSKRPGKKILTDLQEATKSHQVKNTDTTSVNSFFQKLNQNSESSTDEDAKKLTLLLFEDCEIVFENQDEGFISSLSTLISSSKRPIILTSSDQNCAHLQKLMSQHKVLIFSTISTKIYSIWLEILCLIEGLRVDRKFLEKLLNWNRGDLRKTLLQIQFWTLSGGDSVQEKNLIIENGENGQNLENRERLTPEIVSQEIDENSNLSWMDETESQQQELQENDRNSKIINKSCVKTFTQFYENDYTKTFLPFPINLGNLWWNIPKILTSIQKEEKTLNFPNSPQKLSQENLSQNQTIKSDSTILFCTQLPQKNSTENLKTLSNFYDTIARIEVMYKKMENVTSEPYHNFFYVAPTNSLSLTEQKNDYKSQNETNLEINHWLIENELKMILRNGNDCENVSCTNKTNQRKKSYVNLQFARISGEQMMSSSNSSSDMSKLEVRENLDDPSENSTTCFCDTNSNSFDYDISLPSSKDVKIRDSKLRSLESFCDIVPSGVVLDRKASCTDYFSALREICRSENVRGIDTGKRNNRFYHYLRSFDTRLSEKDMRNSCEVFCLK